MFNGQRYAWHCEHVVDDLFCTRRVSDGPPVIRQRPSRPILDLGKAKIMPKLELEYNIVNLKTVKNKDVVV